MVHQHLGFKKLELASAISASSGMLDQRKKLNRLAKARDEAYLWETGRHVHTKPKMGDTRTLTNVSRTACS